MVEALLILTIVVIAILYFVKKAKGKNPDLSYWEAYKLKYPRKAQEICSLTKINFDLCNDTDAKQITDSIERWSNNSGTPIPQLKKTFLDGLLELVNQNDGLTLEYALEDMKSHQMKKEADTYHIKQDNTICRFMIDALVEYQQYQDTNELKRNLSKNLKFTEEQLSELDKIEKELNLAPDISKNNNIENRLFRLAQDCVAKLSNEFKPLTTTGRAEALLFFSTLLVDLGEIKNDIDMDVMEDRYKLLLCDELTCEFDTSNFFAFVNSRVKFFKYQYEKVKREQMYTPMFIYNAFYMNPSCESPEHLEEFTESPITLIQLQLKLYEIEMYINEKLQQIS